VLYKEFKFRLITLGIDEKKIKITRTFFNSEELKGFKKHKKNISKVKFIFLGRVSKLKGVNELIEAFYLLSQKTKDFSCLIIGHEEKPGIINNLKKTIKTRDLSDNIKFLGRKNGIEKFKYLFSSDVFVLPSHMEGCPTSVIEAMATGLFVVSTDVGALDEIIKKEVGIKVRPKKVNELFDALLYCIEDIDKIRNLKERIIKNCYINFEVSVIAKSFNDTYSSLLTNGK
jgi:glycosyltransferase involved in cell wall biosynthesis